MTLEQLETLVKLMSGYMGGIAAQSAKLVLVDGLSQEKVATQLHTSQATVSNGVKLYEEAHEQIKKAYHADSFMLTYTPRRT